MRLLELVQGSPDWHEHRANPKVRNASEASVMMGCSPHTKRTEFIRLRATGDMREYSRWVQEVLFARGHQVEESARAIAEGIIGDDLFPVVVMHDDGVHSASLDGLTIDDESAWECKQWNEAKAECVRGGSVPDEDVWQVVQCLYASGAKRLLYMVTDGTPQKCVHLFVEPNAEQFSRLVAGWDELDKDVENYQHVEVIPAPAANAIVALPALSVQLVGEVKSSNLPAFQESASKLIAAINTNLQTDQDFADAEAAIKWCGKGENDLDTVKRIALSQTATIDELFRTIDALSEQMRSKRLALEKLVKTRKDSIRVEIQQEGVKAYAEHIAALNARLGKPYMPDSRIDFAAAMKGRRTISSLREAVSKALLDGKLEANAIADRIGINMRALAEHPTHAALFADAATLVLMEPQGFAAVVQNRIRNHEAKEAKRLEDERARIQREEEAKAAAKAKAEADKLAEESREKIRAEERAKAEAEAKKNPPQAAPQQRQGTPPGAKAPPAPQRTSASAPAPRPAPPRDEILLLVAERYSVPKTLAAKWLYELFAQESA